MKPFVIGLTLAALAVGAPAHAQIGSLLNKAAEAKKKVDISETDEIAIGADVSARLRERYGVVQDPAIHTYVTLVGSVLASESSRPKLPWTFIVLDTDGINAFAAPGGYIHITRGALSILKNEAELAGVLGHEMSHVTQKHALHAMEAGNAGSMIGDATGQELVKKAADAVYALVIDGSYRRDDEIDADKRGVALANSAGYAPTGLGAFLTRLDQRNSSQPDRNGLFASHPDMKARLDALTKEIQSKKLDAAALVAARYTKNVAYAPVPASAGGGAPASGGSTFGVGGMSALARGNTSSQTVSSGGSRGVNTERDAKGGPDKNAVVVSVTPAEIAAFRKGIVG